MPVASIPSPARGVWHLGPIPIRAYAVCLVLGVIVAVWIADRRYQAAGGRPGLILDVAAWAVPLGLIGARLYSVATDYQLYFGPHQDWVTLLRVWDGGLGMPGALLAGSGGAWIACRRAHVPLGPVAGAAAPGIAVGQAIGSWSYWFSQQIYGRPSGLPWAVQIDPAHRIPGYEAFGAFQPLFLYSCIWDLLVAAGVIWAARRFRLAGGRVFAVYVAAYAVGVFATETLRIDPAHHILGLRVNEWVAILAFAGAAWYLYRTHPRPSEADIPAPVAPHALVQPPGISDVPLPPGAGDAPASSAPE
jgi:prolipoprotein diacylglyceryl transferase